MGVRIAKRDISSAFRMVAVHPDCSRIFAHAFLKGDLGSQYDCTVGFRSLPFGFLASPAYFDLVTTTLQLIHQGHSAKEESWCGSEPYKAFLYIDDGIFVDAELGSRSQDCIHLWETIAGKILGEDCINREKALAEGEWNEEALLLGFILNTDTLEISAPPVKVRGAADFTLSEEFSEYRPLAVKSLQTLRGLMTHWLCSCLFWKTCLQPVDALLSHASEDSLFIRCGDPELYKAFWSMFQLLRNLAQGDILWKNLFRGDMGRLSEVHKRFACPQECKDVLWLTGDATMNVVSSINWNDREFAKLSVEELMASFNGPNSRPPIIADIELISSITGVVIWAGIEESSGEKQRVAIVDTDNLNVFSWLRKGKARVGRARRMLTALLLLRVQHGWK